MEIFFVYILFVLFNTRGINAFNVKLTFIEKSKNYILFFTYLFRQIWVPIKF